MRAALIGLKYSTYLSVGQEKSIFVRISEKFGESEIHRKLHKVLMRHEYHEYYYSGVRIMEDSDKRGSDN